MSNQRSIPAGAVTDVATFTLLSGGNEVSRAYQVISIDVTYEVNRIPAAVIIIQDGEAAAENFQISNQADFAPGREIEIKAGYRSNESTIFKGIVIKHSIKARRNSSLLVVECRDPAFKLTLGERSRYFTEQKDSEIWETLIAQAGLMAEIPATSISHQEVVQYAVSDWDFLVSKAEQNGRIVLAENGKIAVKKPDTAQSPVLSVLYGSTLLELDAEMDARLQPAGIKASGWSPANQERAESDAQEPVLPAQGNITSTDLAASVFSGIRELRHPGPVMAAQLQDWANARLLKSRMAKIRGRVKFQGSAQVKAGTVIELKGVGERFSGRAFVAGIRHQMVNGDWTTSAQLGLQPEWFTVQTQLSGAGGTAFFPKIHGLQTGIVTALEQDPAGEDRIRVRLPAISTDAAGVWSRLVTLDAGAGRGSVFRPEIGDEVAVGFAGSDPDKPLVLGMLHSSAKAAPIPSSDDNHIKGFVSRSEMKWIFDDEKKAVTFETPAGNKIILSEEDGGITLEDQNGNKITMNSSGIEIKSATDLKMNASAQAALEGLNTLVNGQSGTEIKAGGSLKIASSGIAEIKGSLVKIN